MNFVQRALVSCVAFLAITTSLVLGQVATGTAPFNSFGGGPFDAVNLGNLNVHFSIPVFHKAGRAGYNFTYDLSYDGAVWNNQYYGIMYTYSNWVYHDTFGASHPYLSNAYYVQPTGQFCTSTYQGFTETTADGSG